LTLNVSTPTILLHSLMPLYYLNTQSPKKEFFTDAGTIREALLMAENMELVRLKSYYGQQDLKHRYKTIKNGVASPELMLMLDWMPADMILSRLYDNRLHTKKFILETDYGTTIEGTPNGEIIVTFGSEDRLSAIFNSFAVPHFVREELLTNPGMLIHANRILQINLALD
jgi:hypothetical protein